jgi:hypothetical protein
MSTWSVEDLEKIVAEDDFHIRPRSCGALR